MPTQLTLGVQLRDAATFGSFCSGNNELIVENLQRLNDQQDTKQLYLWGAKTTGRTHLLKATCHQFNLLNHASVYIPLGDFKNLSTKLFNGLENLRLIALDDIHAIAGVTDWEEALFHCYNRLNLNQTALIMSANAPPSGLTIQLSDLASRLASSVVYQLRPLNDEQKKEAFMLHVKSRGLTLSKEVVNFLFRRYSRDLMCLMALLDQLDTVSLERKRPVTIALVRELLF